MKARGMSVWCLTGRDGDDGGDVASAALSLLMKVQKCSSPRWPKPWDHGALWNCHEVGSVHVSFQDSRVIAPVRPEWIVNWISIENKIPPLCIKRGKKNSLWNKGREAGYNTAVCVLVCVCVCLLCKACKMTWHSMAATLTHTTPWSLSPSSDWRFSLEIRTKWALLSACLHNTKHVCRSWHHSRHSMKSVCVCICVCTPVYLS